MVLKDRRFGQNCGLYSTRRDENLVETSGCASSEITGKVLEWYFRVMTTTYAMKFNFKGSATKHLKAAHLYGPE